LSAVVGLFPALCSTAGADNPHTVRVGYAPNLTHAVAIVGFCPQKRSYYKAFPGVAFNNRLFLAGPAAIDALRARQIDLAFVGPGSAIADFVRTRDIVVLTNTAAGGTVLVARSGVSIRKVSDLQHRKVAVPRKVNTQDVLLRYQLALNGLRPDDRDGKVIIIPLDNQDLLGVFLQKKIDAACVPEPWGSWLQVAAGAHVVVGSGEMFNEGDYPATLLVARKDFADANPQFVRRFRDVTREITLDIARHKMAYAPILQSEVKRLSGCSMPEKVIANALKRCRFTTSLSTQHDLAVFAGLVDVAGYLPAGSKLDGIILK
jgi:NitT/TauT family transport system substrate-binding protein